MAGRMAYVLKHELKLKKGNAQVHVFKGNSVEDLALRLASVMVGTVPVTINWDSDPLDRIVYKVQSSQAKAVFTHAHTPVDQIEAVKASASSGVMMMDVESMVANYEEGPLLDPSDYETSVGEEDTRIIIYTSGKKSEVAYKSKNHRPDVVDRMWALLCFPHSTGSSGEPKGVRLSYRSYVTNRLTFESFLKLEDPSHRFTPLLVNPMHHTNSTAFTDWVLRRPGAHLHLFERYTTRYWAVLVHIALAIEEDSNGDDLSTWTKDRIQSKSNVHLCMMVSSPDLSLYALPSSLFPNIGTITSQKETSHLRIIAPTVSRHFDFLEGLIQENRLPVDPEILKMIAPVVTFLIGSAPVGPTTVSRLTVSKS